MDNVKITITEVKDETTGATIKFDWELTFTCGVHPQWRGGFQKTWLEAKVAALDNVADILGVELR